MREPTVERSRDWSRLVLTAAQLSYLQDLARRAHPRESCGVLLGRTPSSRRDVGEVSRVEPLRNRSARPEKRFQIAPSDLATIPPLLRRLDLQWLGFFHSHPEGGTVPSREDLRSGWRGCLQLIVGVDGTSAAWVYDTAGPRPVALEVAP